MFWISPEGMARAEEKLVTDPFSILSNYVSYLNPKFLFFYGDNNIRHRLQNMGQLYHFELVTVLAGVWGLFKERRRAHRILSLWLILYPIPAALTEQTHAIRSIMGAPLFAILSAYGFFTVAGYFKSSKVKTGFFLGSTLVVACSLVVFCKFYFLEYPKYGANAWRHGMKEVIAFIEKSPYQKVVMSDRYFFFPPYIYILFYTKYDPEKYQRHPLQLRQKLWKDTEESLGKYHTQSISRIKVEGTVLLCIRPDEIVEVIKKGYDWREVHTVRAPNGWDLISLVKVTGGK